MWMVDLSKVLYIDFVLVYSLQYSHFVCVNISQKKFEKIRKEKKEEKSKEIL